MIVRVRNRVHVQIERTVAGHSTRVCVMACGAHLIPGVVLPARDDAIYGLDACRNCYRIYKQENLQ